MSALAAALLSAREEGDRLTLRNFGRERAEMLDAADITFRQVQFAHCRFTSCDFSGAAFCGCVLSLIHI